MAFIREFPNALDVIIRGVRAGLPLSEGFKLVANEAREPVKTEFRIIMENQSVGMTIEDSVMKMYHRIALQEVNFFAITIQIQSKSGGNITETLSNVTKVIRDRKKLRDKVTAASAEAKTTAFIIGALPFLMAGLSYYMNPEAMALLWTTTSGIICLSVAGVLMLIGIISMKVMINFEI